jgi:hypothetical protein
VFLRGRTALLAAIAGAAVTGTAGVIGASGSDAPARTVPVALPTLDHSIRLSLEGDDIIRTTARRCPKGHAHQIGSFTSSKASEVDGHVHRTSTRGRICAR